MTKRRDTGLRTDGHGSWYVYTDAEASGGLGIPGPIFSIAIPHGIPAVILRALSGPDAPAAIGPLGVAVHAKAVNCYGLVRGGGIVDAARAMADRGLFLVEIDDSSPRWCLPRKAVRRG